MHTVKQWIGLIFILGATACTTQGANPEEERVDQGAATYDASMVHDAVVEPLTRDPACPEPVPVEECFRGYTFAECPGVGAPTLLCERPEFADEVRGPRCLWFTHGCPAEGFTEPCPEGVATHPEVQSPKCIPGEFLIAGWGRAPWDRTREMNLALSFEEISARPPQLRCEGCAFVEGAEIPEGFEEGTCGPQTIDTCLCASTPNASVFSSYILPKDRAGAGFTRAYVMNLDPCPTMHRLLIEFDVEREVARGCIVEFDWTNDDIIDVDLGHEPVCASGGILRLSPSAREADASFTGWFEMRFPDYAPPELTGQPPLITGLTLTGTFTHTARE